MKTLDDARTLWLSRHSKLRTEEEVIPATACLHRFTSRPLFALRSVPHYHGAAMDGYAVVAADTFGANDTNPVRLHIGKQIYGVDTGDPLPSGTNAVIMIEHAAPVSAVEIEIRAASYPWQHVRKVGEDIVAGELLLPQHHRLRPADIGSLLAAGILTVPVFRKPEVWIQPTGTELIPAGRVSEAAPGEIIEFNGTILCGMVEECGGVPVLRDIVADEYESIKRAVREGVASAADVVLINAGSSAGTEDFTAAVIDELGEVLVHGVAMMPGKPVILGIVGEKPVIGIPGYPVSAIMAFEQFVRPLLYSLQGTACPAFPRVKATLGRKTPSKLGLEEFTRVILGKVEGRLVAMPIQRGAGIITSLTRADGILQIPQEQEGADEGEEVEIRLMRPQDQLDFTLIMIGSHDNTIDAISNELKGRDSRVHLSSSNVGSLGGLLALRRRQAHFAGSHLLDTDSGEYNYSYIERYLKGTPVRVVQLAMRQQGLLIRSGNPKGIKGIEDLVRPEVSFINRQAGSGTRVLFDYALQKHSISADAIKGYDQEEFTHMAVAVNVLSGRADAGMAIYSSAKALGLDFIPVAEERYDLVIGESAWSDFKVQTAFGHHRFRVFPANGDIHGRIRCFRVRQDHGYLGWRQMGRALRSADIRATGAKDFRPGYVKLFESGELLRRAEALEERLTVCDICPRACGVNRTAGEIGYCGIGVDAVVAAVNLHPWEEPPISGQRGSGTIFFSGCSLKCVFCQNYPISQLGVGRRISAADLASRMLDLQNRGAHNINLVTPTHQVAAIVRALVIAVPLGLQLPLVYNSSGYESLATLVLLNGIIDLYLPDIKYSDPKTAQELSGATDYVDRNREALKEMWRQCGPILVDEEGIACSGMIVRHMVLPEDLSGTRECLCFLADNMGPEVWVSLMNQYFPAHKGLSTPPLDRKITEAEYDEAFAMMTDLGLNNGFVQDCCCASES